MATTTVTEQIPADVLEDIRDNIAQAAQRDQEAARLRSNSILLEGEAAGFRAAAGRIIERKLKAGKDDTVNIETGSITRVVEVADPAPVDPPAPVNGSSAEPEA